MKVGIDILSFDTEAAALEAAKKAHVAYIKDMFSQGKPIRNGGNKNIETLDGLTDEEISLFRVCGFQNEEINFQNGLTNAYVKPRKAYQIDKWFIRALPAEYMDGIVGYTEMQLPSIWLPPLSPSP